jgi:hypothetical protein
VLRNPFGDQVYPRCGSALQVLEELVVGQAGGEVRWVEDPRRGEVFVDWEFCQEIVSSFLRPGNLLSSSVVKPPYRIRRSNPRSLRRSLTEISQLSREKSLLTARKLGMVF